MRLCLLAAALAVCSACVTVSDLRGPDGSMNKLVSCLGVTACYEKATEVCGGTYKIVNSTSWSSENSSGVDMLVECP